MYPYIKARGFELLESASKPAKFDMKFWQISSKYKKHFLIMYLNLTLTEIQWFSYAKIHD